MIHKTDKRKKEKDKIHIWKCIRCQKKIRIQKKNCTGCGLGRTMDYISHRTLAKISGLCPRTGEKNKQRGTPAKNAISLLNRGLRTRKKRKPEGSRGICSGEKLADLTNSSERYRKRKFRMVRMK